MHIPNSEEILGWMVALLAVIVVIAFALSFAGHVEWSPLQLASLSGIGTTGVIIVIWLQFKSQSKQIEILRKTIEPEVIVSSNVALMGIGNQVSEPMISLTASNTGNKPVTLSSCGIELTNNESLFFLRTITDGFPRRLEIGESHSVFRSVKEMKSQLFDKKPLNVWFQDETGKKYKSKWYIKEILGLSD